MAGLIDNANNATPESPLAARDGTAAMILTQSGTQTRPTRRHANSDGEPFYHNTFVGQNRTMREATTGESL